MQLKKATVNDKHYKKIYKDTKKQILSLKNQQTVKRYKLEKALNVCFGIFCAAIFIGCLSALIYFGYRVWNNIEQSFGKVIISVTSIFGSMIIALFVLAIFSTVLLFLKSKIFINSSVGEIDAEISAEIAKNYLRDNYGVDGEYIITRCFFAFDSSYNGEDVYVLINGNKLNIIPLGKSDNFIEADLSNCYVGFPKMEEHLRYGKYATVISDSNDTVVLGKRTLSFIKAKSQI